MNNPQEKEPEWEINPPQHQHPLTEEPSLLRLTPEQEEEIRRQMEQPKPQHQPGKVNPEALPEEERKARANLNRKQRKAADKKFLKAQGKRRRKKPKVR